MKNKKLLQGYVVSNKMVKTLVVAIPQKVKHHFYNKFIKRTTKIYVHIENVNICNLNDVVEVQECHPYSKTKSWTFLRIIKKAH